MDHRLMLVDDDSVALDALSQTLRRHFPALAIESFTDPSTALLHLVDTRFGVVITDFNMPTMNGLSLLRTARERGIESSFIVVTADAADHLVTDGLRLGMFGLLTKPLNRATLVPLVQQAMECYRLRQEVTALRKTLQYSGLEHEPWLLPAGLAYDEDSQPWLPF